MIGSQEVTAMILLPFSMIGSAVSVLYCRKAILDYRDAKSDYPSELPTVHYYLKSAQWAVVGAVAALAGTFILVSILTGTL